MYDNLLPLSSNARMGTVPYALVAIARAVCKGTVWLLGILLHLLVVTVWD